MTKAELIKALEGYPDNAKVCFPAAEDGFMEVTLVESKHLRPNENKGWGCGSLTADREELVVSANWEPGIILDYIAY